jgi:hypothetical protein
MGTWLAARMTVVAAAAVCAPAPYPTRLEGLLPAEAVEARRQPLAALLEVRPVIASAVLPPATAVAVPPPVTALPLPAPVAEAGARLAVAEAVLAVVVVEVS